MPLTDVSCKGAQCPVGKSRERYADGQGLYLEVTPSGSKLWRLKYRYSGKEKRLALGVYPSVTLGEARRARDTAKGLLASGVDPMAVRHEVSWRDRSLWATASKRWGALVRKLERPEVASARRLCPSSFGVRRVPCHWPPSGSRVRRLTCWRWRKRSKRAARWISLAALGKPVGRFLSMPWRMV